jgi:AraC-like DNA-binding protein
LRIGIPLRAGVGEVYGSPKAGHLVTRPAWNSRLPVPGAYFDLICRELADGPDADAALREGTGVAPGTPAGEITLGQQARLLENASRLRPPGWSLAVATVFDAATHGPVGFAAVSAPTLADALATIARFAHVRMPYFRFESHRDARRLTLRVDERVALPDDARVASIEGLMLSVQRLVELIRGRPIHEAEFAFAYAAPPYAARYADAFHGTVRFDADRTALAVPAAWLGLPCPMADPAMYQTSLATLEMLARRLEGDEHVVARIEQLIAGRRGGRLSLAEVAKRVHVSTRTLIRRLRRAGTTYHDLLDAHLRASAEALLADPHIGIAQVSLSLGYEDPANFGRACRRWFGVAPGEYRRRVLARREDAAGRRPRASRGKSLQPAGRSRQYPPR